MAQEKAAEIIDLNASRGVAADGEMTGALFGNARRAGGLSLSAVSTATKIKIEHLEAIEAGDLAALPATPYAVGFVKVYANYLGLDAEAAAVQFKGEISASAPSVETLAAGSAASAEHNKGPVGIGPILGIGAVLVFVVWIFLQILGSGSEKAAAPTADTSPRVRLAQEVAPAPRPNISSAEPESGILSLTTDEQIIPTSPSGADTITPTHAIDVELSPPRDTSAPEDDAMVNEDTVAQAPRANINPDQGLPLAEDAAPSEAIAQSPDATAETTARSIDDREISGTAITETPEEIAPAPLRISPPVTPRREPVIVDARLTRSKAPRYPNRCDRDAAELEQVTIMFDITAAGRTANPRTLLSTNDCFNDAALAAIGKWRFDPRTVDGTPQPTTNQRATLNFRQ